MRELTVETLRNSGEVRLRVTGMSMLPCVWPGDVITVRRGCASDMLPGQIVLCYRGNSFFAHRVIERCGDGVVTRGDSLAYEDAPFREDEVLGEVVSIVRRGRLLGTSRRWWQPAVSRVVRRSTLGTRVLLRLKGRIWAR